MGNIETMRGLIKTALAGIVLSAAFAVPASASVTSEEAIAILDDLLQMRANPHAYYLKLAEEGDADAQNSLGDMYKGLQVVLFHEGPEPPPGLHQGS